jgi:hypothetical protein
VGIFYFDLYKVLMDTGALHSSYISRDLVDKHRDVWRGKVMHVDGEDCLGDNKTEVSVTKNVKIDVLLRAPDQWRVTAIVNFCVWDMLSMECQSFWITSWWYWRPCWRSARRDGQSNTEADTVHHGLL